MLKIDGFLAGEKQKKLLDDYFFACLSAPATANPMGMIKPKIQGKNISWLVCKKAG